MNTPGGNTVSTAEQTITLLMALARHIPAADASLRAGQMGTQQVRRHASSPARRSASSAWAASAGRWPAGPPAST